MVRPPRIRAPRDLSDRTHDASPPVPLGPLGLRVDDLEAIWSAVEGLYRTGLHPAIALCVRRCGEVVLDRALGYARGGGPGESGPQVPVTPETPFCIFSASKSVTAVVLHLLDERGVLHLDDRVAAYLPEYAQRGKERTTIRHLLAHQAGIPSLGEVESPELLFDHTEVVRRLCAAPAVWTPGRHTGYHAVTSGYVLAEVVQRAAGRSLREVLQAEILDPLGFAGMNYGASPEVQARMARNYSTGRPAVPPLSGILRRALGASFSEAVELSNDPRFHEALIASGNVVGTANEVSRFFELLRRGGTLDGVRVFSPQLVERATAEASNFRPDWTFVGIPQRYSHGFFLGRRHLSLYGPDTAEAYGHLGFIHMFMWADPRRELSVALLTSGKPALGPHLRHVWTVLKTISGRCRKP